MGDGHDVQDRVDASVAVAGEAVASMVAAGGVDRGGAVVAGGVAAAGPEPDAVRLGVLARGIQYHDALGCPGNPRRQVLAKIWAGLLYTPASPVMLIVHRSPRRLPGPLLPRRAPRPRSGPRAVPGTRHRRGAPAAPVRGHCVLLRRQQAIGAGPAARSDRDSTQCAPWVRSLVAPPSRDNARTTNR